MATREQKAREWRPFERVLDVTYPGGIKGTGFDEVWMNNRYFVMVRNSPSGGVTWLSIRRADRQAIHDWRDLQRIKNELCGREREAIEIYPAESRLVDTSNQYHLWVLPRGMRVPFGYDEREVCDEEEARKEGAVQRPFDTPPEEPCSKTDPEEPPSTTQSLLKFAVDTSR